MLPVNSFKWVEDIFEFNKDFMKTYNVESDKEYFFEVDIQYLENLHNLQNDLPILSERIITEKIGKLASSLHYNAEYVISI